MFISLKNKYKTFQPVFHQSKISKISGDICSLLHTEIRHITSWIFIAVHKKFFTTSQFVFDAQASTDLSSKINHWNFPFERSFLIHLQPQWLQILIKSQIYCLVILFVYDSAEKERKKRNYSAKTYVQQPHSTTPNFANAAILFVYFKKKTCKRIKCLRQVAA